MPLQKSLQLIDVYLIVFLLETMELYSASELAPLSQALDTHTHTHKYVIYLLKSFNSNGF